MDGHFYPRNGRWWWKVRFPGKAKESFIALKPKGSKFATKDRKIAEIVASEIWQNHLRKNKTQVWDGKLPTLIQLYHQHNLDYYLPPSREAYNISLGTFPLAKHYPDILADEFTPLQLKEFQKFLVESPDYNWCRKLINERIRCIKRMFKWAASETLISIYTYTSLTTLEGLRKGRTKARDSKVITPADLSMVEAVIDIIAPVIADMIRIQMLTGMRSGELCKMRPCNIDRSEEIWIYQPKSADPTKQYDHKKDYAGIKKIVPIGPKAQAILAKYLFRNSTDYCFKPEDSYKQHLQKKSKGRKTPLSCGNRPGTNNKGIRKFNDCFDSQSYLKAVKRACKTLYPAPKGLTRDQRLNWERTHSWHPHQLRHMAGTGISKQFGIEAARAVLGHKKIDTTEYYVQLDLAKAKEVAKMIG